MHRNPRPDSIWLMPILVGWVGIVVAQGSFTLAFAPSRWNAFVSMVLTARVYQRFEAAVESGVSDGRFTCTFTTRVRVRP